MARPNTETNKEKNKLLSEFSKVIFHDKRKLSNLSKTEKMCHTWQKGSY